MLDLSRIRAICFDLDGTLADTDDAYVARIARWLAVFPAITRQRMARRIVMDLEAPAQLLLGWPQALQFDGVLNGTARRLRQRLGLPPVRPPSYLVVPGASECVAVCAAHYPLAVVTSRDAAPAHAFLKFAQLEGYFACIASAFTTPRSKPHPDPIVWVAQYLGIKPEQCLIVGDTTMDIRTGQAAGAQTVSVLCGFGEEPELRAAGADLILRTTADLPTHLGLVAQPQSG